MKNYFRAEFVCCWNYTYMYAENNDVNSLCTVPQRSVRNHNSVNNNDSIDVHRSLTKVESTIKQLGGKTRNSAGTSLETVQFFYICTRLQQSFCCSVPNNDTLKNDNIHHTKKRKLYLY